MLGDDDDVDDTDATESTEPTNTEFIEQPEPHAAASASVVTDSHSTTDVALTPTQPVAKKAHAVGRQRAPVKHTGSSEDKLISTLAEITKVVAARKVGDAPSANELFGNSVAKTLDAMSLKQAALAKFRIQQVLMELQLSSQEEFCRPLEHGTQTFAVPATNYSNWNMSASTWSSEYAMQPFNNLRSHSSSQYRAQEKTNLQANGSMVYHELQTVQAPNQSTLPATVCSLSDEIQSGQWLSALADSGINMQ